MVRIEKHQPMRPKGVIIMCSRLESRRPINSVVVPVAWSSVSSPPSPAAPCPRDTHLYCSLPCVSASLHNPGGERKRGRKGGEKGLRYTRSKGQEKKYVGIVGKNGTQRREGDSVIQGHTVCGIKLVVSSVSMVTCFQGLYTTCHLVG